MFSTFSLDEAGVYSKLKDMHNGGCKSIDFLKDMPIKTQPLLTSLY